MAVRPGYKQTDAGLIPEDWGAKPMGSLTSLMTNGFVGTVTNDYIDSHSGVVYVQGYNVEENGFNFHGIKRVSQAFHAKNQKSCLKAGDLLTIQTGDIGVTAVIPPSLAGANCHALVISRFDQRVSDPGYYCQYFNSERGRKAFKEIETGSTMKHLNVGEMVKLVMPSPPLPEQRAIAAALSDVDALLAKLDQFIAKKRDLKQAAMQQLLTGQTRLPGFSGEWEVKRLGDVAEIVMGQSPSSANYNKKGLGLPLVQGNADILERKTITRIFTTEITKRGNCGDILMSVRAPVGEISRTGFDVCLGRGVCAIRCKSDFLYHYLISIEPTWARISKGSTFDSVNSTDVKALEVNLPSDGAEQTAIATVLSDMDAELVALEARRDKTRALKQGMMQELLTGRIRLVQGEVCSKRVND